MKSLLCLTMMIIYIHTYTLIQADFSVPVKYKTLMRVESFDLVPSRKYELFTYIRENNLVEIKQKAPIKKPQIDLGYGSIVAEVLEELNRLNKEDIRYSKKNIHSLIMLNVEMSKLFINDVESINTNNNGYKTMYIRVSNNAEVQYSTTYDRLNEEIYSAIVIEKTKRAIMPDIVDNNNNVL